MTRLSFGDWHVLCQAVWVAARRGEPRVISRQWWVIREKRRQNTWQPFTFRDYLRLRATRRGNRRRLRVSRP